MKLIIGPNIDEKNVRLDFKASPSKPENIPSYTIKGNKADEFVKEYNAQSERLKTTTKVCVATGGVVGWLAALEALANKTHNKMISAIGFPIGMIAGGIVSSIISYEQKNKLMDKYQVKKYKN